MVVADLSSVRAKPWQPSWSKAIGARVARPLILLLNRPKFAWFGRLAYSFALACNGVAIAFPGRHGLTASEERFLKRQAGRLQNGVVLDVGANGGAYLMLVRTLAPRTRIFAFEPHPVTFAHLCANVSRISGAELINKAVGEAPGCVELYDFACRDGSTQASIQKAVLSLFTPELAVHRVQCTTIDQFAEERRLERIDFLKIDTEGNDLAVLKGARRMLDGKKIRMIQFEFIPENVASGVRMLDFLRILAEYKVFRMCLNGDLLPLGDYDVKQHEIYGTQNLVAVPREP